MKKILQFSLILLTINCSAQTWQWANRMGSVLSGNEKVAGVGTDNAGNVYVAGQVLGYPTFGVASYTSYGNYYQGFLAKYDCSGNLIWVQLLLDNNAADKLTGLAVDGNGNCYLNGFAGGNTTYFGGVQYTFGNSPGWFIAKYNSSGAVQWHIFTQSISSALTETGPVIALNSQGNIIAAGWNSTPGIVFPGINLRKGDFIAAFNPATGACLWGVNIDTVAVNSSARHLQILSMKLGTDNDIYFTGWFNNNVPIGTYTLTAPNLGNHGFILKYNINGNLIWAKQDYAISTSTSFMSMALSINSIYIFGNALRNDTVFNYPLSFSGSQVETNFILKLDTAANFVWGITQDSANNVYAGPLPALVVDNNGNLYCTNGYGAKLKWGTTHPSINSNPSNKDNLYLLKLNSSGQVSSLMNIPCYSTSISADDGGEGIAINNATGDVYIGGAFSEKLWAHAGDTVVNTGGNVDLFLVKYGAVCATGIDEVPQTNNSIIVYPNPFTSQTTISFAEEQKNTTIKVMDVLGKEIKTINFTGKQYTLDKGAMSNGIYFIKIADANKNIITRKIIIQ